jgi:hypothetical protein
MMADDYSFMTTDRPARRRKKCGTPPTEALLFHLCQEGGKCGVEYKADAVQGGDYAKRNAGRDDAILDSGGAGIVREEGSELSDHAPDGGPQALSTREVKPLKRRQTDEACGVSTMLQKC